MGQEPVAWPAANDSSTPRTMTAANAGAASTRSHADPLDWCRRWWLRVARRPVTSRGRGSTLATPGEGRRAVAGNRVELASAAKQDGTRSVAGLSRHER